MLQTGKKEKNLPHLSDIHFLKGHLFPLLGIALSHLSDDGVADVDVGDAVVAHIIHVFAEPRVPTANHQHLVCRLDVLVQDSAQVVVLPVPKHQSTASLSETTE